MKCFQCDASMATGATLFRVNEKGVPGIWACTSHRLKVDPIVDALVSVIASAGAAHSVDAALSEQTQGAQP